MTITFTFTRNETRVFKVTDLNDFADQLARLTTDAWVRIVGDRVINSAGMTLGTFVIS